MFGRENVLQEELEKSPELQPLTSCLCTSTPCHCSQTAKCQYGGTTTTTTTSTRTTSTTLIEDEERSSLFRLESDASASNSPFPFEIPNEVKLTRIENLAVPACYLTVGIVQGLTGPLLNVYPLNLGATEAAQVTLSTVIVIPATIKILYGFLSDSVPILGSRRKPYMFIGWSMVSVTMITLVVSSDLSMYYDENEEPLPPKEAPSIELLSGLFFLLGVGLWLADVMGDSIVAEKARLEPEAIKGNLQATCYSCRFFGMMVAAPLSTFLYSTFGPRSIVYSLAAAPLVIVIPLILFFQEEKPHNNTRKIGDRLEDIWTTVKSRAAWQPMAFIFLYNILQVSNGAWRQFLKSVLLFSEAELNLLLVASYALLYFGTLLYKNCFLQASWRRVYLVCIILNGILSAMQLFLITGHTFGLSPFVFALGDDAFGEFIKGVQFLPLSIMMMNLCPKDSEGTAYSMFTTFHNSALLLAPMISTTLLGIWDTSKEALEANDVSGMFKLSLLTTVVQMSPLLFLSWLPHSNKELQDLNNLPHSGSKLGGAIFLMVVFCSMSYIVIVGALNIFVPNWLAGSR